MFGAVGTLQNVATISSTHITPVVVPVEVPVVVPVEVPVVVPVKVPVVVRVTTCAATGDVAKSSAVINASFFICTLILRWSITDQSDAYWPLSNPSVLILTSAYEDTAALSQLTQPRRPITGSLFLAFALHFYAGQPLRC